MNHTVTTYSVYLPIAIGMTIWVTQTVFRNSTNFLDLAFKGREKIATAVNNLLQQGFYLIAFGTAFLMMEVTEKLKYNVETREYDKLGAITNNQQIFEALAQKMGGYVLILGIMVAVILFMLLKVGRPKKKVTVTEDTPTSQKKVQYYRCKYCNYVASENHTVCPNCNRDGHGNTLKHK